MAETPLVNNPHALYYNGELIGVVTNPDPHGNIQTIVNGLSPDEGLAEARPLPRTMGASPANIETSRYLAWLFAALGVPATIPVEDEDL
jgi:hypothetical protein